MRANIFGKCAQSSKSSIAPDERRAPIGLANEAVAPMGGDVEAQDVLGGDRIPVALDQTLKELKVVGTTLGVRKIDL